MGALAGGLGSFPFDHGPYHPQSDSRLYLSGIRSLIEISTPRWGHHPFSALPPVDLTSRLALKLFRREPAISVFDWNFTPSHKSSKHFQRALVRPSSQCYLTFSLLMASSHGFGSTTSYSSPYSDSLSLRLRIFCLTSHDIVTRRFILQKARHHPLTGSDYL